MVENPILLNKFLTQLPSEILLDNREILANNDHTSPGYGETSKRSQMVMEL